VYAAAGDNWSSSVLGGVYRSLDNGDTWESIGLEDEVINALAVDPSDGRVIYAGATGRQQEPQGGYLVYRSRDAGETWDQLSLYSCCSIEAMKVDPNAPNIIFASAGNLLYKSSDGGDTWALFYTGVWGEQFQALHIPFLPPSPVTGLSAQVISDSVRLTWNNPADPDLAEVSLRVMTDTFPTAHTQGISLTMQTALPVTSGVFTHTGVLTGMTYFYTAFAYDVDGRYSEPAVISATLPESGSVGFPEPPALILAPGTGREAQSKIYLATSRGLFMSYDTANTPPGEQYRLFLPLGIKAGP
jgi:hypothetical protein